MSKVVLNEQEGHWYLFELEEAGEAVGRLQFWSRREDASVAWIEVDEKARRRGLAVDLYTALKAWCQANGVLWLNGRIENCYALWARNRVFGEPFDIEVLEPMERSPSSTILLVTHAVKAPSAPERPGPGEENSRA